MHAPVRSKRRPAPLEGDVIKSVRTGFPCRKGGCHVSEDVQEVVDQVTAHHFARLALREHGIVAKPVVPTRTERLHEASLHSPKSLIRERVCNVEVDIPVGLAAFLHRRSRGVKGGKGPMKRSHSSRPIS